jgi:tetratricopeptide (TPR) repeat protein
VGRFDTAEALRRLTPGIHGCSPSESVVPFRLRDSLKQWTESHLPSIQDRYLLAILLCRVAGLHEEGARLFPKAMSHPMSAGAFRSLVEMGHICETMNDAELTLWQAEVAKPEVRALLEKQPYVLASHLTSIGRYMSARGKMDEATAALEDSIAVRRKHSLSRDLEVALQALAEHLFKVEVESGHLDHAYEVSVEALAESNKSNNPEGIARCHLLLGRIFERVANLPSAREHYEGAVAAARHAAIDDLFATCCGEYGLCLWIEGEFSDHPRAAELLAEALRIHSKQRTYDSIPIVASNLALCLEELGDAKRSLLADCIAFHGFMMGCALDAAAQAEHRVFSRAQKLGLPPKDEGMDVATYVAVVHKVLIEEDILI